MADLVEILYLEIGLSRETLANPDPAGKRSAELFCRAAAFCG
jgi:hypothetical protein